MIQLFLLVVISAVTFLVTFIVRNIASCLDIVDKPSARKVHKSPVPLLGGLCIYIGFITGLMLNPNPTGNLKLILMGASIIFLMGLIDDIRKLSAKLRLVVQMAASLIVIFGGIRLTFLPRGFLGNFTEMFITLVWLVGVTNAFNYLDGLDGLACGSAIINTFYFWLLFYVTRQINLSVIPLILLSACLGFLPHNFRRAKIFLGDAGSMFLGFMLAGISVAGNWAQDSVIKIAIPILILGVPIFDMTFTTIVRIKEGKIKNLVEWLKYAGKDHFHHYLVYLGFPPLGAVLFIWTCTFFLGISAIMLGNDRAWEGILTLFQACVIFAIIGILIVVGRKRRSGWSIEE
ncbi:MAG: undecaprenyl/decaprenyl-phosphate alpha-N-acetylglucosaminyl 1-phosphate transferase [Candidatus Omnitrophica bacterium]|nr:undecaprenyl/decaprenyl-phosphate alpha-N-acetylglucosaminyl 1-phosphate transferase [Candidatus Omnitrophota bacterium]